MSALPARVCRAIANGAWLVSKYINSIFPKGELPYPSWAPGRLLKNTERMPMTTMRGCFGRI